VRYNDYLIVNRKGQEKKKKIPSKKRKEKYIILFYFGRYFMLSKYLMDKG